jgi:hypothetical protein
LEADVHGWRLLSVCVLAIGAATAHVGCERAASKATESSTIKPLAVFYGQFTGMHKGQPPANEAEFKEFIRNLPPESLKSLNVTDVESLFVSSRDKQPYIVKYGQASGSVGAPGKAGPGGMPVIAYEQVGVDGKRYIATTVGAVEEVDDARFRVLVPDAK